MTPFLTAYLTCALWSSTADDGEPMDRDHGIEDFHPEALARAESDCEAFQKVNAVDLEDVDDAQAGHDFWLTRNGHGTGFWDRDLGPVGDRLTEAARAYGEAVPYFGDDGELYLFPHS